MKKRSKMGEYLYTVIFTVIMTAVCIFIVSFAYQKTKTKIKLNEELFLKKAILDAAGIKAGNTPEDTAKIFAQDITVMENGQTWYRTKSGNYVIPVTGTGLWGKINAVIGIKRNLKEMTGISFTSNNETPGLGARITEKWFCEQFRNKRFPLRFVPEGTKDNKNNEFDAVTGATITTTAVRDMINKTAKEAPGIVWGK